MVRKRGKHQRSKQRCQDLGWKVHDRAKSFVLRSCTINELSNQHVSLGSILQYGVNNYCVFLHGQGQKSEQKPKTKNFVGFHNHSLPLTML